MSEQGDVRRDRGWSRRRGVGLCWAVILLVSGTSWAQDDAGMAAAAPVVSDSVDIARQERIMALYEKMIHFNLESPHALPVSLIDSLMTRFANLSQGDRIAAWADYFWQRGDVQYVYGLDPNGYVSQGRLVDDCHTDCILFFHRVTELGRSSSALEAVQFAFGTRFLGAVMEEVVDGEGRVDYGSPVHLDYACDMIRSGIWGAEITETLGETVPDPAGSTRFAPGSVRYVPKERAALERLRSGDIVYLVSNEATPMGQKVRATGAVIGHVGIIKIEQGQPFLIHAASQGLAGIYAGGKVEKVRLQTYLERVENFKGLLATRIEAF